MKCGSSRVGLSADSCGNSDWTKFTYLLPRADLLHETAEHHDDFEKTYAAHNWWDCYASYLSARQNGSTPEIVASTANNHMETVLKVLPK
jgi:hypothetical protein